MCTIKSSSKCMGPEQWQPNPGIANNTRHRKQNRNRKRKHWHRNARTGKSCIGTETSISTEKSFTEKQNTGIKKITILLSYSTSIFLAGLASYQLYNPECLLSLTHWVTDWLSDGVIPLVSWPSVWVSPLVIALSEWIGANSFNYVHRERLQQSPWSDISFKNTHLPTESSHTEAPTLTGPPTCSYKEMQWIHFISLHGS